MATLVRQRKFKKVKKTAFKKKRNQTKLIYPTIDVSIKWLRVFILFVIFSYGLFFIINNTIFKDENYIEQITYSKMSVDTYDNPYLYKRISELIKYENYYIVSKLRKGDIENTIKLEFPLVEKIKIIQPEKYMASVKIEFYTPDIIIKLGERKFGVIGNYNFEIFNGNKIDQNIFFVELPQYATGIDSIAGLFYEIQEDKFIYDMNLIAQGFPNYKRIVYLPGSSRTVVFITDTKRIYLNNKNLLTGQIENYNLLLKNYNKADGLKIIDLGSLENDKIIVRQ